MNDTAREVLRFLDEKGIAYDRLEHDPAATMQDCAEVDRRLGALTAKNCFLTTKNKKHIVLCLVRPEARFHTADISKQLGSARLSFGTEEQMAQHLRVFPGAVSPLGLMFDRDGAVELAVDEALLSCERLSFHPCDNSATVALSGADFFGRFLPAVGHGYRTVEIHDFMDD